MLVILSGTQQSVESFDQLLWELEVLDVDWDQRNPLQFYMWRRLDPENGLMKRYASFSLIGVNLLAGGILSAFVVDPPRIAPAIFLAILAFVSCFVLVARWNADESTYLQQREQLLDRVKEALSRESLVSREQAMRNLWRVEEMHSYRNVQYLLFPWEERVGSGKVLMLVCGLMTLILILMKPDLAIFSFVPFCFGLARFFVWRRVGRLEPEFFAEQPRPDVHS